MPFETIVASYNDIERTRVLITEDLALVLVEPMIGTAGVASAAME